MSYKIPRWADIIIIFLAAFIEKNTWAGVEENFEQLKQQLQMAYPSRDAEERSERRAELPHPPAAETMTIGTTKARHPRPTRRRRGNWIYLNSEIFRKRINMIHFF